MSDHPGDDFLKGNYFNHKWYIVSVPNDGTNNKFVLDVYSKAETDSLFATADAMEYKGTFNPNTGTLPASPHNGDTLKVSSAGTVNGEDVKVGDLLIYVEDKTNASNSRWEIIPSGDD